MKKNFFLIIIIISFVSCVSKKKMMEVEGRAKAMELKLEKNQADCDDLRKQLNDANNQSKIKEVEIEAERTKTKNFEKQIDNLKNTNQNLLDRLTDLSVLNKAGAENVKKSLETMTEQGKYIKDLNASVQRKDSLNLALVMNIKRSLDNVNDKDINVEVKKGVVYISISDKLMFKSGSDNVLPNAENVLSKIAKVVNDHKDFDILIEGHTDNVPMKTACIDDNWDLSTKRATSIVRYLQKKYKVDPKRMTAGGRGEYVPKTSNATAEGRTTNRRTEIVILPKLDEFFQLLEKQQPKK
ncbi:MAG: hypothetical protein EAZ85_00435 [Bacteroidetes bacterium]|nr:MAG: hypothetical protein EAZ85_00435 [Bacteroidota bacterium]TAG90318.1 MAG: hypothetical protein EAZ20_04530 [Bacteroidota bacterium]